MSWAQKKKMMMAQQAAGPSTTPITGLVWVLSTFIGSSGQAQTHNTYKYSAACNLYSIGQHRRLRYTGPSSHDGTAINVFVHEYEGSTWKRRVGNMNTGAEFTLNAATTGIRITFAYPQSAGKTMTQDVVDDYANFEWTD